MDTLHIISIVFWESLDVYVQNYKCLHPDAKQKTRCLCCLPCAFYIMMGQLCQKNTEALVRGKHALWNHASEFHLKIENPTCYHLFESSMLCSSFESYQILSGFSVAPATCCELQVSFFISKWSCRSVSSFHGFCWAGYSQHCLQTKFRTDTGTTDVKTTRSIISICKVCLRFCSKVFGALFK